jgi:hypothetical protein
MSNASHDVERGGSRPRDHHRPAHLSLIVRLVLAAAAVVAVALGVVGIAFQSAPSAPPPAGATTIRSAVAPSAPSPATILDVAVTAAETAASGARTSWSDDAWVGYPVGPGLGFGLGGPAGFRQVLHRSAVSLQTAVFGRRLYSGADYYRFPGTELYEASTNTIYELHPALAGGVYLGGPSAAPFSSGFETLIPSLWSPCTAEQVENQVHSGVGRLVGSRRIDGRRVVEFTASDGTWTYYADARTNKPVRLVVRGIDAVEWPQGQSPRREPATLTFNVRTYDQLPFHGNEQLLNLAAQHPGARIDSKAADYYSAQARLFSRRRWG